MTQTQKVLIALASSGSPASPRNRFAPAWAGGPGDACRRFVAEARSTCYSQLLSERLISAASQMRSRLSMPWPRPTRCRRATRTSSRTALGSKPTARPPISSKRFSACGDGFSSGCRHGVIQAYFESREQVTQPEVEALCQPFKSPGASRWVLFQWCARDGSRPDDAVRARPAARAHRLRHAQRRLGSRVMLRRRVHRRA